ncbi:MAG: GNAT family N-acetyltransferase [Hyphomicrobiaceae bacterium]
MLTLRRATVEDAPLLRRWDEEPHVVASDPTSDWQWETELAEDWPWREQLVAEVDAVPIGFVQIIDPAEEESHYWGDVPANLRTIDIWIGEAACLGRGYGTSMMRWAIDFCFAAPAVEAILIDPLASNTRAIRFYQRLGFRPGEERQFGDDLCLVHRLERADWQVAP